jgi:hypothetical protein
MCDVARSTHEERPSLSEFPVWRLESSLSDEIDVFRRQRFNRAIREKRGLLGDHAIDFFSGA